MDNIKYYYVAIQIRSIVTLWLAIQMCLYLINYDGHFKNVFLVRILPTYFNFKKLYTSIFAFVMYDLKHLTNIDSNAWIYKLILT